MGRIADAYKTLVGRSRRPSEVAKMRAEFTDLMVEINSALEKLNMMAARLAKRESRARQREEPPSDSGAENGNGAFSADDLLSGRKAALYRRARAKKGEVR